MNNCSSNCINNYKLYCVWTFQLVYCKMVSEKLYFKLISTCKTFMFLLRVLQKYNKTKSSPNVITCFLKKYLYLIFKKKSNDYKQKTIYIYYDMITFNTFVGPSELTGLCTWQLIQMCSVRPYFVWTFCLKTLV